MKKNSYIILALSLLSFIGTCFMYQVLPSQIPIHFDYSWNPDGYASREMIFLTGAAPFIMYLLFRWLPKIDPKKKNYEKHKKPYDLIILFTTLLMIAMNWVTIALAMGKNMNAKVIIPLVMGIVFICMGNYLPKVKSNFFVGIKTPWALSNDIVWRKTNRFGGYVFILVGILLCIDAFVTQEWFSIGVMLILLIGVIINFIYSYLVFKKIQGNSLK